MKFISGLLCTICFSSYVIASDSNSESLNYFASSSVSNSDIGRDLSFSGHVNLSISDYLGVSAIGHSQENTNA